MSFEFDTLSDSLPKNNDQMQQLLSKIAKAKRKVCMLENEVVTLTADNDQLQKEKQQWIQAKTASANASRPPFTENNTTMNLMDDLNGTYTDGFFDDHLASIKRNQVLNPSHLGKENRPQKGDMTLLIESREMNRKLESALDEKEDLQAESDKWQETVQTLEVQIRTFTADLEAVNKANDSKDEAIAELQTEIEDFKSDIIKANKKAADYEAMKSKCQEMETKTAALEVDYVKKKDEVKQGNNLFAEVEERRHFVEKAAVGLKEEALKVRQQRNQLQAAYDKKCRENRKLQVLVTEGSSSAGKNRGGDDLVNNRDYQDLKKRYHMVCEDHRRLEKEVNDWRDQAKGALGEESHRYNGSLTLDKMFALKWQYDLLLEEHQNLIKANTDLNDENENLSYKYKVLDYYNNQPDDHKCSKSECATQTEDDKDEAEAGECKQQ